MMEKIKNNKRYIGGGIAVLAVLLIIAIAIRGGETINAELVYAPVERGTLVIDILEAASIESSDSQVIKSEVEGQTTIISIIPEGTILTEEDVANERILVELDSSNLRERQVQQEITVQSELASFTDAKESYEIQKNENESNLKAGELKILFAQMDVEKFLGAEAAKMFIEGQIALGGLIDNETLGGDALLDKQTRQNNIALAEEDVKRAQVKLGWTEKLLEKGYRTRDEFEADQLQLRRLLVDLEKRKSELDLYIKYDFPKQAEKLRSDYAEAKRELVRIEARNRAQISRAEARLKSNEATYKQQLERLQKIDTQIANCVIKATKTGMVVYAGGDNPWRTDNEIIEGATVRERQELIKIPNATTMVAKARIHESVITRVKTGLPAEVTIDALPGQIFRGEVQRVALLPDAQNRWMNPNLKVYATDVLIYGESAALKPGMSAQVRIIINTITDAIKAPVQAITSEGDQRIVFVDSGGKPQKRYIEVGDYNDKFMHVPSGLKAGERVVMNPNVLIDSQRPRISPERSVPEEVIAGADGESQSQEQPQIMMEQPAIGGATRSVPGGSELAPPAAAPGNDAANANANAQMRRDRAPREGAGQPSGARMPRGEGQPRSDGQTQGGASPATGQ